VNSYRLRPEEVSKSLAGFLFTYASSFNHLVRAKQCALRRLAKGWALSRREI
jgi:hypothetical protein